MSFAHEGKGYVYHPNHFLNYDIPNSTWVYDKDSDSWTESIAENIPERRVEMFSYSGGLGFVGSGIKDEFEITEDEIPSIWTFNPVQNEFTFLTDVPSPFQFEFLIYGGAFTVHDNKIYTGGGFNWNSFWWAYDISTDTWEQKADLPNMDAHRCVTFGLGDFIYVLGGHFAQTMYKYDIVNDNWISLSTENGARHACTFQRHNGKVYIYGGDVDGHEAPENDDHFVEYDPVMDTWTNLPSLPNDPRRFQARSFIIDGTMYLFGGASYLIEFGANLGSNETEESINSVWSFDLNQINPTSIKEANQIKELIVSPNPTTDLITIQNIKGPLDQYTLMISDMSGKQLYSGKLSKKEISLDSLFSGAYVLTIYSDEEVYSAKVLKQ